MGPYSDGDEQDLIDRFRAAGALEISLVAERDVAKEKKIVGQVSFTEAFPVDGSKGWYALGPVAVEPELQSQRIGAQLIEEGLAILRECDAKIISSSTTFFVIPNWLRHPETRSG